MRTNYLINPAVAIIAVSGRLCRDSPHCHPTVSQGLNESQLKSSELTRISFSLPRATCSREPQSDRRQAITCMFPLPRIQCGCRSAFGIPQLRRGAAKIVTSAKIFGESPPKPRHIDAPNMLQSGYVATSGNISLQPL